MPVSKVTLGILIALVVIGGLIGTALLTQQLPVGDPVAKPTITSVIDPFGSPLPTATAISSPALILPTAAPTPTSTPTATPAPTPTPMPTPTATTKTYICRLPCTGDAVEPDNVFPCYTLTTEEECLAVTDPYSSCEWVPFSLCPTFTPY